MPNFVKSVLIDAPLSVVFAFHEREDALSLLSPPFLKVRMAARNCGIHTGARVELRIAGFSWIARHTAYEKDALFVDEQVQGPFAKWVHRHEFADLGGKTRLTDRLEYQLPGGWITNTLVGWVISTGLHFMFSYRHRVTREFCERE